MSDTNQNNPLLYASGIQAQLTTIFTPIPVYANFNRNWATEPKFVTWQLRNVHQPVYTGNNQTVKGIDNPVFQVSIFAQKLEDVYTLAKSLLDSLHGYAGYMGTSFYAAKIDVHWLYNTYDNEIGLQQIILDCTMDVPVQEKTIELKKKRKVS